MTNKVRRWELYICATLAAYLLVGLPSASAQLITWVSFHDSDEPTADAAAAGLTEAPGKSYTDLLRGAGYDINYFVTHTGITQPEIDELNASSLVIVSRNVNSPAYQQAPELEVWNTMVTSPVMMMSGYITRSNRLNYTDGTTMVDNTGPERLVALEPNHPVFEGVALDANNEMVNTFLDLVPDQRGTSINNNTHVGATLIAAITDDGSVPAGPVIAEWPAGATINNGDVLAGRRMTFMSGSREASGVSVHTAGLIDLEPDGIQMFLNAVNYLAGGGDIVAGDVNGDGVVDQDDFQILRANFGRSVSIGRDGDLNFNARVDEGDFRRWKDAAFAASGATSAVPEPSTILFVVSLLPCLARRMRRRA